VPPVTISGIPWLDALLVAMGAWGYLATFVGGTLENLFIAGSLVPGETVVLVVAAAAAKDPNVGILWVWVVSIIGTTVGSGYHLTVYWQSDPASVQFTVFDGTAWGDARTVPLTGGLTTNAAIALIRAMAVQN